MVEYYIDEVKIFIDGEETQLFLVTGAGYDSRIVQTHAENEIRKINPNSIITSVIQTHQVVNYQEYKRIIGSNPQWLIDI
jgi:hypothetical protein